MKVPLSARRRDKERLDPATTVLPQSLANGAKEKKKKKSSSHPSSHVFTREPRKREKKKKKRKKIKEKRKIDEPIKKNLAGIQKKKKKTVLCALQR